MLRDYSDFSQESFLTVIGNHILCRGLNWIWHVQGKFHAFLLSLSSPNPISILKAEKLVGHLTSLDLRFFFICKRDFQKCTSKSFSELYTPSA